MPVVRISAIEGRTQEEKHAVMTAVHQALIKSFEIP